MVIVFRGTETTKEWIENATLFMEQLDGEPDESGLALLLNRNVNKEHCKMEATLVVVVVVVVFVALRLCR